MSYRLWLICKLVIVWTFFFDKIVIPLFDGGQFIVETVSLPQTKYSPHTHHLGWNWVFFFGCKIVLIYLFFIFFNWDYISMWSIGISNTYISTLIKIKIGKKCKKKKKGELNLKKKHWIRIIWNSSILIEKLIRKLRLQATY